MSTNAPNHSPNPSPGPQPSLPPSCTQRCIADPAINRVVTDGFAFPKGSYPVESLTPKQGYAVFFEPADGDDDAGEWEEWPDRYVYDIVISAERVPALCRSLFALLPPRLYPILDVLGHDAYREIDPYISYDLLGFDRFLSGIRSFHEYLFEDGLVGFGAMSDDPFFYVFVDEHKIITVRASTVLKDRVERILQAFDLEATPEPAGADSAAHEHRGVLTTPGDRPELLSAEEIVEYLRDDWRLVLNVDPDENVDEEGNALGTTPWIALVRFDPHTDEELEELAAEDLEDASDLTPPPESSPEPEPAPAPPPKALVARPELSPDESAPRYAEIVLSAESLREAEDLALDASDELLQRGEHTNLEPLIVSINRLTSEDLQELLSRRAGQAPPQDLTPSRVLNAVWL